MSLLAYHDDNIKEFRAVNGHPKIYKKWKIKNQNKKIITLMKTWQTGILCDIKKRKIVKRKISSNSENHFYGTLDKYHDENLPNRHHV
jgi:phage I-like protein